MGLGILGRGLGYTKFLAKYGADLIVTDLKTKKQLTTSLKELKKFKNPEGKSTSYGAGIKFVLGKHRLEDFRNRDMIIKNPGVPLDSIYIKEARKNNIPVEMDVSLFAKCAPEVMIVGITGTRGKSMTTAIIYEILKENEKFLKRNIYIGGNVRGIATLPLLEKVKAGDVLVCELDSWQLQSFGEAKISPHISVFTSFMPDHMNYYKNDMKKYFDDKANIFKYQKKGDLLIIRPEMKNLIPLGHSHTGEAKSIKSKLIVVNAKDVNGYKFIVPGEHQRENLACAVAVAQILGVSEENIKKSVRNFKGLEGRLQYVKTIKDVKIYNDNNATTPEATIAGIEALSGVKHPMRVFNTRQGRIILICGGSDKKLPLDNFIKTINQYCKAIVMIPGTGTNKLLKNYKFKIPNEKVKNIKSAVGKALKYGKKGDILLFSPAFASFGQFNNEYERNDLFMKIIKKLK